MLDIGSGAGHYVKVRLWPDHYFKNVVGLPRRPIGYRLTLAIPTGICMIIID